MFFNFRFKESMKFTHLMCTQGKMQFYQTVAMSVFDTCGNDEEDNYWVNYLEYCDDLNPKGVSSPYPLTRALTTAGQIPLGWVMLKFE